jgi:hypothetical protein
LAFEEVLVGKLVVDHPEQTAAEALTKIQLILGARLQSSGPSSLVF